ncbi:pentatricopeptide repeat-containing protein, mitochondrial [Salvia divinorum]|uniref:Pentatricopeptide repeat-containing protein, mitochondrial n=1 Tax=Salvia divinorum TaxID=28513 RepID=A0ABD1FSH4_SALDI
MANLIRTFSRKKPIHSGISLSFPPLVHTSSELKTNDSNNGITSIIDSLHRGESWKTLSQKYGSVHFTNPLVANILLHLKEPINSRKALKFFHWTAKEVNLEHELSNYCLIIHILVKGGLIKDAKAMFESILEKNGLEGNYKIFPILDLLMETYGVVDSVPLVFDLFVQACAKLRIVDGIIDAFELLFDNGFVLSVISFNTLLHVLQKCGNVGLVWCVYELMIKRRKVPNEVTMRIMVSSLCKVGKLGKFLGIVDRMRGKRCSIPRLIVNTCLVYEMIEGGRVEDGLVVLKHMLQKNMILDTVSYSLVVFAKIKMGDLDAARELYEEMLKRGFEDNAFVCSLFVGANCDVGRIDKAIEVLEGMEQAGFKPSEEALDRMIEGCCLDGRLDESLELCKRMMKLGFVPSSGAVGVMFGRFCENGKTREADEMLTLLLDRGFSPDEKTYSCLVLGYCRDDDKEGLTKVLCEMGYRSIPRTKSLSSAIISLCECGRLEEAEKYLRVMEAHSLVPSQNVYEALIGR